MSLKKYQEDLEVFRSTNNRQGIANMCYKIGDIHLGKEKWHEAKRYLKEAETICRQLGNEEGSALTAIGLGDVYRNTQHPDAARAHYQQALEYFEQHEDEKAIANLMERLGDLNRDEGNFPLALEAFSRARDICHSYGDQLGVAHFNERMALVYRIQEDFERAIGSFQEALRYYEEHRVADRLAFVLSGLGELHHRMGQPQEAMKRFGHALIIYQKLGAKEPAELVSREIAGIEATLTNERDEDC